MTPPALFTEMVRTAESILHRQAAETVVSNFSIFGTDLFSPTCPLLTPPKRITRMIRRQEWLAAAAPDDAAEEAPKPARASAADKYGINLDDFRMKSNRRPRDFKKCLRIAEWTAE